MVVKVLGNEILVIAVLLIKALSPMVTTPLGTTTNDVLELL
jgi:hypothetical protein